MVGGEEGVEMMEIQYLKPTLVRRFYVIRAEVDEAEEEKTEAGQLIAKATLETADEGVVSVKATARCVGEGMAARMAGSGAENEGVLGRWYRGIQQAFI